uniref:Ecto-NOX disulfide-thiol exchanger 1/2 domain-containing protein n=1 Tax=Glossina brevipalpis TaxID=37001 RepID=A0A1A9WSP9_9MUSC
MDFFFPKLIYIFLFTFQEENDSLRCQLEAIRNEMSLERTDLKYNSEFREKQIKVLQETIRNMQTQLLQTKIREQKDNKTIEQLEKRLKESAVKQLLLKTKIRETTEKLKDREQSSVNSETSEFCDLDELGEKNRNIDNSEIIDIDVDKSDDEVKIVEEEFNKTEQTPQEISKELKTPKCCLTTDKSINLKNLNKRTQVETETQTTNTEIKTKALPLDEAQLIALTTAFLLVQPLGCKSDTICSYIEKLTKEPCLQACRLNSVLKKYEKLFQIENTTGGGSTCNNNNNSKSNNAESDNIIGDSSITEE